MVRIDNSTAELRQCKRREGDKLLTLRVGYEVTENDKIILSNLGEPQDVCGAEGRAGEWIIGFLAERGTARRQEIIAGGTEVGHKKRAIERALKAQLLARRLEQPDWGLYRVALVGGTLAEHGGSNELF